MTMATEPRSAWQCETCGKIANGRARPTAHVRNGERCGPFSAAVVAEGGAVLAPAGSVVREVLHGEVIDPALRYRVTTLRQYATGCPRSTVLSSSLTTGSIGTAGERGSLMHAAIAEILRTLWRENEPSFERTEEATAILREVHGRGPWVVTAADMFGVRNSDGTVAESGVVQMIGSFAQEQWRPSRFLIIEGSPPPFAGEGRMTMEIVCPDGEIRMMSGAPDLVISDPPSTAIIVDHKQSMAKPRTPNEPVPEGQPIRGMEYLTDPQGDYLQLCGYAALVMHEFPAVKTVVGREKNWRWNGPPREIVISRALIEEWAIPYFGTLMMQIDKGRSGGDGSEFAQPRACTSCVTRCSVKRTCPIPAQERGVGALDSDEAADLEGARWQVIRALDPDMRAALKTYVAEAKRNPVLPDGRVIRWDGEKPNRKFGAFAPPEPIDPLEDAALMQQWADELAVQQAKAGVA